MNEILIYGDIGFEVQAKDIVNQLNDADGPLSVRVDSFGGDVYAGISILNALRRYPDVVTVYVDGIAASAASFIAVGGADRLIMSPNSSLLIHGAWSQGMGNSEEMAQLAADLNQITDNLATIYAEKTGQEPTYWRELMKQDTTFTAEQAVEAGLADAVAEFEKSAKAEKRHAVVASGRSRFAKHAGGRGVPEIETRAAAPPPPVTRSESGDKTTMPSDGRKEEQNMTLLNELAQTLGKSEDQVLAALGRIMNEEVTVNVTVELSYEPAEVVPTDKVVLQPVGDIPPGLVFAAGEAPEGWGVEVAEDTGVVTVTAPAGAEPGDEVTIPVMVTGDGVEVELSAQVTVKAAAPDESESEGEAPAKSAPAGPETVTLDMDTYNWLKDAAARGAEAKAKADEADMRVEVDGWVKEGRLHPQNREKAFEDLKARGDAARVLYSSIPENTFPVREIGHSRDDEVNENKISGAANPFASVRY